MHVVSTVAGKGHVFLVIAVGVGRAEADQAVAQARHELIATRQSPEHLQMGQQGKCEGWGGMQLP